jgi:hypothetical protein
LAIIPPDSIKSAVSHAVSDSCNDISARRRESLHPETGLFRMMQRPAGFYRPGAAQWRNKSQPFLKGINL